MNFPTTAKCEDTFTFGGMYLHQFKSSVNRPGSWILELQSKSLKWRLLDSWQLLLYKLPHSCGIFRKAPIVIYSSVFHVKNQKRQIPKCPVQGVMFQGNLFLYQFNFSLNLKNKGVGLTSEHYVKWDSSSSNYCSRIQDSRTPSYSWHM